MTPTRDMRILKYDFSTMGYRKNIGKRSKKSIKQERELIISGKETLDKLALGAKEIESIFDILEKQNPDL